MKKIQEGFCGVMHTHVPSEPKTPADRSRGRRGEDWICPVPVLSKGQLPESSGAGPTLQRLTFATSNPRVSHE